MRVVQQIKRFRKSGEQHQKASVDRSYNFQKSMLCFDETPKSIEGNKLVKNADPAFISFPKIIKNLQAKKELFIFVFLMNSNVMTKSIIDNFLQ